MAREFLGVGWHFPVESENDRIKSAAHEKSIEQAIWIILATAPGERVMRPGFGCGIHHYVFAVNNATTAGLAAHDVQRALLLWEPRIDVLEVEATPSGVDGEVLLLRIEYRVRSTNNRFNLVYPFYLERGAA
jgi:phage baseplate assembly protein W